MSGHPPTPHRTDDHDVRDLVRTPGTSYAVGVGCDPGDELIRHCAHVRAQLADSRRLMTRAREHTRLQVSYSRAVAARAHEQADRNVNGWPARHGLTSARDHRTDDEIVGLILDAACSLVGDHGSISVTTVEQFHDDARPYRTIAATGLARALDEVQYRSGEGPCTEAIELDMVAAVTADDLAAPGSRQTWPVLSRAAEELDVRSALSIGVPWSPMRVGVHPHRRPLAAVNFYATEPHALTHVEHHATLFGCWAGAIMSAAQPADVRHASE